MLPRSGITRRTALLALALSSAVSTLGCEAAATAVPDAFPDIATVRLVIGGRTVSINELGAESGGPATIRRGTTVSVVSTWHMESGVVDPNVTTATYEVQLEHLGGVAVTFARSETNSLAGTLTAANEIGGSSLRVTLRNRTTGAVPFGPYNVTLQITN